MAKHGWLAPIVYVAVLATCAAALFLPAAGQGYEVDGSTPLRHVLAIVPLGMLGVAEVVQRCRQNRRVLAAIATLGALSVQNAWAYNLHHTKTGTVMVDASVSGWKVSLLFPRIDHAWLAAPGALAMTFDSISLAVWLAISAGLIVWGITAGPGSPEKASTARSWTALAVGSMAATVVVGMVAIGSGGPATDERYMIAIHEP